MIILNFVFEDDLSEAVMIKIAKHFGDKFYIGNSYNGQGFGYIKTNINGFNQAASSVPFFVLTDLDNHECPPTLISNWLKRKKHPNLLFRVAVREVEAWLLADKAGFSRFTGINIQSLPSNPESFLNPKKTLIDIIQKSKKRSIKNDILPISNNASVGPNYNGRLIEFVNSIWSIERAKINSQSLQRTMKCLQNFSQQ